MAVASICRGTVAPDNLDAPACDTLGLPTCTPGQYRSELHAVQSVNPQFNGGPLGLEEHLAADYGCAVGAATIPPSSSAAVVFNAVGGGVFLVLLVALGVLVAMALDVQQRRKQCLTR